MSPTSTVTTPGQRGDRPLPGRAELFLACAALAGSAASWSRTRSTVAVAPVIDGQPVTLSVVYHPQPLVLTLLLATIAGVLSVVGTARLRRARAGLNAHPDGLNQRPPGGWCH
ncbi:transmembrane protein [Mycobacterium tuberculosis variant microti]|nr:transmembrane protein [Mycobacterium tuberculosis variant microti]